MQSVGSSFREAHLGAGLEPLESWVPQCYLFCCIHTIKELASAAIVLEKADLGRRISQFESYGLLFRPDFECCLEVSFNMEGKSHA